MSAAEPKAPANTLAPVAPVGPGGDGATAPAPERRAPRAGTKPADPLIGHVLNNRFRIESKIGEGGFGSVYRGVQLSNGRKVALKLLHPEMTKDKNLVARFRREGLVLCNLKDAHTITTYDFDQTSDGTLYIAMELLEGKSLHQVFQAQAPLDWRRVFKIISEMCSSLAEAHAQGVVHRDLKPENVYLENRAGNPEFVKILDFGIAKVMKGEAIDPNQPNLTATGQTLGTLEYMSPEQLMGRTLDGRSDVYALGVVAYEMITKRLPFPDAKGPAGLITAQIRQTPPPPSKANPNVSVPPVVDKIILKCLEKDKNNRYADVTALATAVQEALLGAGAGGPPILAPDERRAPSAPYGRAGTPEPMVGQLGGPGASPSPLVVPAVPSPMPVVAQHPAPPVATVPHLPQTPVPSPVPSQGSSPYPVPLAPMTPGMPPPAPTPPASARAIVEPRGGKQTWIWVIVGVVVLGAVAGAVLALTL